MDHFFLKKRNSVVSYPFAYQISKTKNYRYLQLRPKLWITDQKFYLPCGLTDGQGSLPVAIMARNGQSGRLLMSKPDSCEIISKSD